MSVVNSPNMNLPVPVVGDEAGPQYAIDINACLAQVDFHDHTPGQGVQITPSALNLNADVPFNSNNATLLRSTRYVAQGSPIAASTDLNCLSVSGVDLYYRDGSGNIVRITQSGGVAGSPGSIANLTSPASASYVAINSTFVWQSDANVAASMDFRSAILRNAGASSFGLTLQAPALSGDVTQTLPQVPAATAFVTMASTGSMGTTIPIAQGITNSMLADNSVSTSKIVDGDVTLAKMDSNSVDTAQIIDASVTPAKLSAFNTVVSASSGSYQTTSASQNVVVSCTITTSGRPVQVQLESASPSSNGLMTIQDNTNPPVGIMYFTRDTTDIASERFPSTGIGIVLPIAGMKPCVDAPGAGTYTYKLQANVISSPTTVLAINNMRLRVYEL